MADSPNLNIDTALGVTLPSRHARGRLVRLGPALDAILAKHAYPPVMERLLAEALALTALLGSLLKDPGGQMTLQAQTESGIVDLLVCDYLGGQLRGYIRHDAERLAEAGPEPDALLVVRARLSRHHLRPAGERRALPGHRPFGGREPGAGGRNLFHPVRADPEHRPPGRAQDEMRAGSPAACCSSICRKARRGGTGCTRGSTIPNGPHVAVLAGSARDEELTDPGLPLDDLVWRLFHEEEEVRTLEPVALSRGCRCDPDYVKSVIARFPPEERAAMVGDDGFIRVDCAFCATDFPISLEDVA